MRHVALAARAIAMRTAEKELFRGCARNSDADRCGPPQPNQSPPERFAYCAGSLLEARSPEEMQPPNHIWPRNVDRK